MKLRAVILFTLLGCTPLTAHEPPQYERSDYRHWIDADGDCEDTRSEVLRRAGPTSGECRVSLIRFTDPYTGEEYAGPAYRVHVDHLVPLAEAHRSGGWAWTAEQRETFANDPFNLLPTLGVNNLRKGDRDPAEWMPTDADRHCWYIHAWLQVKAKYKLSMDGAEVGAVVELLRVCAQGFTSTESQGYTCPQGDP